MIRSHALLLVAAFSASACAGEPPAPPPNPRALLAASHAFASKLKSLACEIDFLRTENSAHRELERRAHFDAAFQRPNQLSILLKDGDLVTYAWICDGQTIYTYLAGLEKYSTHAAPATLEALLASDEMYVVKSSLDDAFLLDDLQRADRADATLPGAAVDVVYVAAETVLGRAAHHLRLVRKNASWNVWLAAGDAPLPLKIQADISTAPAAGHEPTKIEFTVEFKNWHVEETLDAALFKFDPNSKAKRVGSFLKELPPHPLLNQAAPDIALTTLDGTSRRLSSHRGRDIVVLDFWAIGCMPCVGLLPKVAAVAQRFDGKGVVFYAMDEDDAPEKISEFFRLRNIALRATIRNKDVNFPAYKIDAIPQTFVIDRQGVIRVVHSVQTNDLEAELSAQLEALLAGKPLPKTTE
jgi:peroxiredoxin